MIVNVWFGANLRFNMHTTWMFNVVYGLLHGLMLFTLLLTTSQRFTYAAPSKDILYSCSYTYVCIVYIWFDFRSMSKWVKCVRYMHLIYRFWLLEISIGFVSVNICSNILLLLLLLLSIKRNFLRFQCTNFLFSVIFVFHQSTLFVSVFSANNFLFIHKVC